MEQWYVLHTVPEKEEQAVRLFQKKIDPHLWNACRVLKKRKVFRSGGSLRMQEQLLFPGYVFVKTEHPKELAAELKKAGAFPQFVGISDFSASYPFSDSKNPEQTGKQAVNACLAEQEPLFLRDRDLEFLQHICGINLEHPMGLSKISLNRENRIIRAEGALEHYLDKIVKLNLHKRFAVVEVELFQRKQSVLFGVQLEQDEDSDVKKIDNFTK